MTVRVVVVDDHPVVRAGVVAIVDAEADLEVVGEAEDGPAAIAVVTAARPDVVLMDLRMPGGDGVAAIAELASVAPDVAVLVVTTYATDDAILSAVEAGATGYVLKDAPAADLVDAIRRTAVGETVLAGPVAATLMRRTRSDPTALTPREVEILAAVAEGATNKQVAAALHIGPSTVKTHLLHIYDKLAVDDRTGAVTEAYRLGILAPPV